MKNLSLLLAVLALFGVGALFLLGQTPPIFPQLAGTSQHFDTQSFYDGIRIGAIGGATENNFIREINCVSVPKAFLTTAMNCTSTMGIAFAGVETSSRQVYFVSTATSTSGADNPIEGLVLTGAVTSTAGSLQITVRANGVGLVSAALPVNACYVEFTTSTLEARF